MGWTKPGRALLKLPGLVLMGRLSVDFDGIPLEARGLSLKRRLNLLKAGLDSLLRPDRVLAMPPVVQIEPTNRCVLACPLCPSGLNMMKRPGGRMPLGDFRKLLDSIGDCLLFAYLYGWGEPFLNRDLTAMIGECSRRGIGTLTSTSGQLIQSAEEALAVVDSGLSALIIAMDGSTQETYGAYRRGGDVEKVKRCALLVEEAKAKRGSPRPYTNLRAVVSRHNEHDIENIERFAREANVNMFSAKSLGCLPEHPGFGALESRNERLRRFDYDGEARKRRPSMRCIYPYRQPTIFCGGEVMGCEFDYDAEGPWGNVGEEPFAGIWNNEKARAFRKSIRTGKGRPEFCARCPYRDRVGDGVIVISKELRPAREGI